MPSKRKEKGKTTRTLVIPKGFSFSAEGFLRGEEEKKLAATQQDILELQERVEKIEAMHELLQNEVCVLRQWTNAEQHQPRDWKCHKPE